MIAVTLSHTIKPTIICIQDGAPGVGVVAVAAQPLEREGGECGRRLLGNCRFCRPARRARNATIPHVMISLLNRSHGGPGEDIRWISVFANGNNPKKSKKR